MQIAPPKARGNRSVNNHDNDSDVEGVGGTKEDREEGAGIVAGSGGPVNVVDTADFISNVMDTLIASMHPNIVPVTSNSGINISNNETDHDTDHNLDITMDLPTLFNGNTSVSTGSEKINNKKTVFAIVYGNKPKQHEWQVNNDYKDSITNTSSTRILQHDDNTRSDARTILGEIRNMLFQDRAAPREAAAMVLKLILCRSENSEWYEMLVFRQETQHETNIGGLAIDLAIMHCRCEIIQIV